MRRYVDTPSGRSIQQLVESTVHTGGQALIVGRSGVGKTAALTDLAARDRRAAYVAMRPAQASMRGVLTLVGHALGIACSQPQVWHIDSVLSHELYYAIERERYVIIDEAQMLPLECVRQLQCYADHAQLYDLGSLPIIFAGNEFTLKKTRTAYAGGLDQIITRIENGHSPLRVDLTAGDIDAFAGEYDVEPAAYETLRRFGRGRNCRALIAVLDEARRLAGGGPIRSAELREALLTLHGPEAVKVVPLAGPAKRQERLSA